MHAHTWRRPADEGEREGHRGGEREAPRKLYFFKIDADTLLHPHHLLPLLEALRPLASSPSEPILFGLASCRRCHALPLIALPYATSLASCRRCHSLPLIALPYATSLASCRRSRLTIGPQVAPYKICATREFKMTILAI